MTFCVGVRVVCVAWSRVLLPCKILMRVCASCSCFCGFVFSRTCVFIAFLVPWQKKKEVFFYVACLLHCKWDGALSMFAPL